MTEIEKLRTIQLMIACEIKRVCEKNDISYFLDAGSMLGAIRHNGYIPWDDDIDIGMIKKDYEKFLKVAPEELDSRFYLDNEYTNPRNPYVFSKVRLKGTKYIENIGNSKLEHNEIFVDVFPYYYISDHKLVRKLEGLEMAFLSQALLSKYGYKVWRGKGFNKRIKFIPSDIIGIIFPVKFLRKLIKRLYTRHEKTEMLCIQSGSCYDRWYFPQNILMELEDHIFENITFKIPKNYDYFLTKVYGDYMKLPPQNERVNHQIRKLEFGEEFHSCEY